MDDIIAFLSYLQCSVCDATYEADQLWNLCEACGRPLFARYDIESARRAFRREMLGERSNTMWRYAEMLPVRDPRYRISLGEGMTPLLQLHRLGDQLGLPFLYGKDEGQNPTGSFKARGVGMAVARATELGVKSVALPSAGNAGSALAAYASRAGLPAHIFLPQDVPAIFISEARALGAEVTLVEGLITDCARRVRAGVEEGRWFDLSTLKEPYRVEGKKTMGYELAEQFDWTLPDVVIYPTGGGTGLVGMWKAFAEMEALGWIGAERPRMISVQSSGCAPIVRAFENGAHTAEPWRGAATVADGLRVPAAVGDVLILEAIRESGGTALAVTDEEILDAVYEIGSHEGLFVAPEAAATLAALHHLVAQDHIDREERVVLFFTGTGLKYTHLLARA